MLVAAFTALLVVAAVEGLLHLSLTPHALEAIPVLRAIPCIVVNAKALNVERTDVAPPPMHPRAVCGGPSQ